MYKRKLFRLFVLLISSLTLSLNVFASGVHYLPGVTSQMSEPSFWTNNDDVLMTYSEISALNELTISTRATCMYDLKKQSDTLDGVSLNSALLKSTAADASYYAGWTYLGKSTVATKADFDPIVQNSQNPNPQKVQNVKYGIAVKRTELRAFPSPTPLWDDPNDKDFDYQYLSAVRVNEPLVITSVSADGKYYLAKSICCSGWIPSEDVAVCKDKTEWLSAWDISPDNTLIVYGDKVYLECSNTSPETSALMLTMGTVLELAPFYDPNSLIDNRAAYQNYSVWIPLRMPDGSYSKKLALISEHHKVSVGYLPLTEQNISEVAFSALGNIYGWGGSLSSDDCSGYVRNIYKCFGLELARNTSWQSLMPMGKIDMQYMCREERIKVLNDLPFGSVLYFNGHEMLYLGSREGNHYVISAVSSIMNPQNTTLRQRVRSTLISTLDVRRANGNSWLDDLNLALVPYYPSESQKLPQMSWYHDGVAFCLKNSLMKGDQNKCFNPDTNITWAEICQILYNMEDIDDSVDKTENAKWYDTAVNYAKNVWLFGEAVAGFNPETPISREELATVLLCYSRRRNFDVNYSDSIISKYADASQISSYAHGGVCYVTDKNIMNGKTDNTFNPSENATRAEIAVIIERFYKLNGLSN